MGAGSRASLGRSLLTALRDTLDSFVEIGLGYLSLDRASGTLSGGEAQRTKMIRHLGSALTDVTYVFDEPTIGLHPHDIATDERPCCCGYADKGNTVLVVEHKPEVIDIADHVVDLGPGAGSAGGDVVFEGAVDELRASDTFTGRHLDHRAALKQSVREPSGMIEVRGADLHNLQSVDVDIPLGVLVVVTGVAGSGKSSLVHGSVSVRDGVVAVDQTPIRGSRRAAPPPTPACSIRFARRSPRPTTCQPSLFSANSEGACPVCGGSGVIDVELGFMDTVSTPCEDCEGKGFAAAVLEYSSAEGTSPRSWRCRSPRRWISSAVETRMFGRAKTLRRMSDVGLGYLTLGQPLTTLSGGERQRLKLAIQMGETGDVYVLDEPTTGLHLADVDHLLDLLDLMVDSGTSVIVISHHQAVMAHADWIIDLGPGAGHDGGRIVFEGTPADLVADRSTLTGCPPRRLPEIGIGEPRPPGLVQAPHDEHELAHRISALESPMRQCCIGHGKGLAHVDPNSSIGDEFHGLEPRRPHRIGIADAMLSTRIPDIPEPARPELDGRRHDLGLVGSVSEVDQPTEVCERLPRLRPHVAPDRIEHDVHSPAAREVEDALDEAFTHDDMVVPVSDRSIELRLPTDGPDRRSQSQIAGRLSEHRSHASRRAMEQHRFTGSDAAAMAKQVERRREHAGDARRGRIACERGRQRHDRGSRP